jgi:hypothetical protein
MSSPRISERRRRNALAALSASTAPRSLAWAANWSAVVSTVTWCGAVAELGGGGGECVADEGEEARCLVEGEAQRVSLCLVGDLGGDCGGLALRDAFCGELLDAVGDLGRVGRHGGSGDA